MDVLEGRFRIAVTEQAADGQDGLAGLQSQTRIGMTKVVEANVPQPGFVAQPLPQMVQALRRRAGSVPCRKDPGARSGQPVQNRAGGGGQPDRSRSGLAVPQEQVAVAPVLPLQGQDFVSPAAGQDQQPDRRGKDVAVIPCKRLAQLAGFLPGKEPLAAASSCTAGC